MLGRIKRWWANRKPAAFEHAPHRFFAEPRFRVQRKDPDGVLHEAYSGEDGTKAAEAIEAYRDGILYGEFWVFDRHHAGEHRGYFKRWPS